MNAKFTPKVKDIGLIVVLAGLVITFSVLSPNFLDVNNIYNITRQVATLGICAVGFTFILITGGIDLSIGYQISVNVVVCGMLMANYDLPWYLAVLAVLALGTLMGMINGIIITVTGVSPLIITLAMMTVLNGVSYLLSRGLPIFGFPSEFSFIGQGTVAGIPVALIILLLVCAIGLFILNKTYLGKYFYAIGNNREAARLSGINTPRVLILVYALSGFFTAIGSVVLLSRLSSAQSATGSGFEFMVITACVLGGVSVMGGRGTLFGAFLGVAIIGVLNNGLVLLNVNEYVQLVITGAILLIAVSYDALSKSSKGRITQISAMVLSGSKKSSAKAV
ncbi:ABC transporter permease [Nesterenkonia sp.]|uniref:ABC transporter permease n=1 Tax=Nesterenkonia sp. TaxID=704201 RepID=UPI00260B755B|nr:ABC transporter permease [Nesterenkonia sp.]